MNEFVKRIWILPAAAMALPVILLAVMTAPGIESRFSSVARNFYEVMFWAAPLSGVITLLIVSAYKVFGAGDGKYPPVKRAVRLGGLALFSPIWLLALQILLSGFAR